MNKSKQVAVVFLILLLTGCGAIKTPIHQLLPGGTDLAAVDVRGSYQTDYPIQAPAFRGLEPVLQLSYDSGNGNGWLGVGWRISGLSSIKRVSPGKGVPTYTASDVYLLDGLELVPCAPHSVSPSCRYPASTTDVSYSTLVENFERIGFEPAKKIWHIWSKTGVIKTYAPRQYSASRGPYLWDLVRVEDTLGNAVAYRMLKDTPPTGVGESYLDTISYDGFQLKFYYEDRPDPLSYGIGIDLVTMRRRLKAIDVTALGARSVLYELEYVLTNSTVRSFLHAIHRFGTDALIDADGNLTNPATALTEPAMVFDMPAPASAPWNPIDHSDTRWGLPQNGDPMPPVVNGVALPINQPFLRFTPANLGDFDGNGQTDWIQAAPDLVFNPTAMHTQVLITTVFAGKRSPISTQQTLSWPFTGLIKTSFAADVNGDGRSDLVFLILGPSIPSSNPQADSRFIQIGVALSRGDGTFDWASTSAQSTTWETRELTLNRSSHCEVGDVDGDGKADVLCSFTKEDGTHFLGTARSNGDGTFQITELSMPFADQGETRLLAIGDVNGDGLADPMFLDFPHCPASNPECTVNYDMVTAFSKGNGNYDLERTSTTWPHGAPQFFAADIDGDGKSDYVVLKSVPDADPTAPGALLAAMHQPGGSGYVFSEQSIPAALRDVEHSFTVGDANGDGKTDLMVISRQDPNKPGCSSTMTGTHVNLHRVLSLGNGQFTFPNSWENCSNSHELPIAWDDVRFTPVEPQAADLNGDGTADFLIAAASSSGTVTTLYEDLSTHPVGDVYNWIPAQLNGDGRKDWLYVRSTATGPLIFGMLSNANGYTSSAQSPVPGTQELTALHNWKVFDVDGDGLDDLVYLHYINFPTHVIEVHTWFAQQNGTWRHTMSQVLAGVDETFRNTPSWRVVDANGDGRGDLVYLRVDGGQLKCFTLISNGDGTWNETWWSPILPWTNPDLGTWMTGDMNGDGRTDLVHITNLNPGVQIDTLLSTGDGRWAPAPSSPSRFWTDLSGTNLFDTQNWKVMDFNGDGLSDLVHLAPSTHETSSPTSVEVQSLISHGDGSWSALDQTPAGTFPADMQQWRVASVDRDERQDLVHYSIAPPAVVLNTLTFSGNDAWSLSSPTNSVSAATNDSINSSFFVADVDGDGADDLTRFDLQSPGMRILSLTSQFPLDVATTVTNRFGGTTNITYGPVAPALANDSNNSCRLPSGIAFQTVSHLDTRDGRHLPSVETFDYSCARWSQRQRTFLGWENLNTTIPNQPGRPGSTTLDHQLISDQCLVQPDYTIVSDNNGRAYHYTITAIDQIGNDPPYQCKVLYRDDVKADNPSIGMNVYTYYDYDEFGNVAHVYDYGANEKNGNVERTIYIAYKPNTAAYIVGLPFQVTIGDGLQGSTKIERYTYYCYDGDDGSASASCQGTIKVGQLTAIKSVNKNGWYDTTTLGYDTYGNLSSVSDPNNHVRTITTYDPDYHLFPQTICNALTQCATLSWNAVLGLVKDNTDENSQLTHTDFDTLGRTHLVTLPDGATLEFDYLNYGDPTRQHIHRILSDGGTTSIWRDEYFDGLGRLYSTVRRGNAGQEYVRDTEFLGGTSLVRSQSHWYTRGDTPVVEQFDYDLLGRLLRQTHPDRTFLRWAYDNSVLQSIATRTDEVGEIRTFLYDAYGRLSGVKERLNGQDATTNYQYDAADELLTATDAASNATIFNWDIRGNNFNTTDPDRGARTYYPDYVGNVKQMVDAKGAWTTFYYDALDRVQMKQFPSSREVDLVYDEPGHGASVGRLTSVIDSSEYKCPIKSGFGYLAEERFYDARGRLSQQKRCIEGVMTQMLFSYDKLDRLQTVTYPDHEVVTYGYDDAGRPKSLSGWVTRFQYNAADQLTEADFANGTSQSYSYDSLRQWLSGTTVSNGPKALFQETYQYYPNTRLESAGSPVVPFRLHYDYDGDRLSGVTRWPLWQTFSFDNVGNMSSNSPIGSYSYNGGCGSAPVIPCPHAVKQAGINTLGYDENGNLTSVQTLIGGVPKQRTITWNADAEAATFVDYSGITTSMRYDMNGRRVYRERDGLATHFYGDFLEMSHRTATGSTQSWIQYYYGGDVLIGRKDPTGQRWLHTDRLGSVRLVTDSTGASPELMNYAPFGLMTSAATGVANEIQFTGHRSDTENNMIDMGGRFYEPTIGRFISPDPIVSGLQNLEALNPFSYAYNNPTSNYEIAGYSPTDAGDGGHLSPAAKGSLDTGTPDGGSPDGATVNGAGRSHKYTGEQIYRIDDYPIKFWFPDTPTGWGDFHQAEAALREGMKGSDLFSKSMWEMLRGSPVGIGTARPVTHLTVDLESLKAQLKGDVNAFTSDLQGAGPNHFLISMMPSGTISGTQVQRAYIRTPGDLDLPDGGLRRLSLNLPVDFRSVLWHEIGHDFGAFSTGLPLDSNVGQTHPINTTAIQFMFEAYRVFGTPLSWSEQSAIQGSLHPLP